MTRPRRALVGALALGAFAACTSPDHGATTMTTTTTTAAATTSPTTATDVPVNGTTLHVERRGSGDPVLVIHGGGEDASMLAGQADALAAAGFEVVTYDRRGTGRSGRDDWPGRGAGQHAEDAAALLAALDLGPAVVLGVSSGGVIALELAARHPEALAGTIAWEPPLAGVVPGGVEATAAIMAPVEAHLARHRDDFVGAQAILLSAILGFPVGRDDPTFTAARANAEPMIRDEPAVTLATPNLDVLAAGDVTIAVGSAPNELVAAAVHVLAGALGREPVRVDADHEVYLVDPSVLVGVVTGSGTAAQ